MITDNKRPMTAAEERTMKLSLQEISAVFHMPLHEACVQLQADEPTLKKRYRELGINAWPYRKRYKFDDPNIESLVRSAMTKGRPKKLSPDTPKSPSLFGNFILATKKKSKKEEESFHGSTASPVPNRGGEDTTMSESSPAPHAYQEPQGYRPQQQVSPPRPDYTPQWSQYTYQNTPSHAYQQSYYAPQFEKQPQYYPQQQQPQRQQPMQQQQYPKYDTPYYGSPAPQQQQNQQLPSIRELLNTPPQHMQHAPPQQQYGLPQQSTRPYHYQNIKPENDRKDTIQDPRRYDTRGTYSYTREAW